MSDAKCARVLLQAAERDMAALRALRDSDRAPEEVFGFHVQQTAEKALKAWIALLGVQYPLTHSIAALLELLERRSADVAAYQPLHAFTPFAAVFRYESVPEDAEPIRRAETIRLLERLTETVGQLVEDAGQPGP